MLRKIIFQYYLLITFTSFIVGCGPKENPTQKGILKITAIGILTSNTSNNLDPNNTWNHIFPEQLILEFKNTKKKQNAVLAFAPNRLNNTVSLELEYGDYEYSFDQKGKIADEFLPVFANSSLKIDQSSQEIALKAETNYALITVRDTQLDNVPKILLDNNISISMNKNGDLYYQYLLKGQTITLEISPTKPTQTFKKSIAIEAYKHYHFLVGSPNQANNLQSKDFQMVEEIIPLTNTQVPSNYSPTLKFNLTNDLNESSGLAAIDNDIWTINDSGNKNEIYQINMVNGSIQRKVTIKNSENIDWESMAQSSTHVFIADIGNNSGIRKDLVILKIPKDKIVQNAEVEAEKIYFSYEDQNSFDPAFNNNDFDCEAILFYKDEIHLFTKNWKSNTTKHYKIPANIGTHIAKLQNTFNSDGLITAADIDPITGDIVLLGYTNAGFNSQSFVWLLSNYTGTSFFSGKKSKINLGSLVILGQTEGILLLPGSKGFISSERIQVGTIEIPAKLFEFDFKGFF